ncbi:MULTISPECIES: hypothetical protein [Helicobacter]|uniref:hypothetical protein n=1 Tax=Helicobacter TaxID=209 RepID=UPI0026092A28|nr:hypothetical protein [Helicobacter sp. UBA3407]
MKKLILGFLLIFGISSTLFAEVDFIALATNGEFNEQSAGVKVLNEEEMGQVVGGATLLEYIGNNTYAYTRLNEYGTANNSGSKVSYTAYYQLIPEYNNELGLLNVGGNSYTPAVSATYNFFTNSINLSIIGVSRYNPVYTRSADRYYADKLFEANGGRLKQEAIHLIRQDKSRYR